MEETKKESSSGSIHYNENVSSMEHDPDQIDNFKWDFDVISNLAALYVCFFASTWMLVVPSSEIGFIMAAFPLESSKGVWIATSVTITNCVVSAVSGLLSDILGRKPFLLVGMALGFAGALVSGRAKTMEVVIGGQVLSSAGLSLGYLAIALTSEIVPKYHRPKTQALTGISAGIAAMVGAIIAGAFVKHNVGGQGEGWRVAFYLGAGFYALSGIAIALFYHPHARPNTGELSTKKQLLRIDWVGIFLVAAGLTLFLVGLFYGGNPNPWKSAMVLGPMIVGIVIMILFGLYEWKVTSKGLLDHSLFKHKNFSVCLALNFVGGIVLFGGQAYLPQEILFLFTQDAVLTGVDNLPFNVSSVLGGVAVGVIMIWTRESKWLAVASLFLVVIGSGLMAVMQPHINYAAWFFPTAILGISIGIQTAVIPLIVSVCTPNELIATGISISNAARSLGGSIGTVIFSQIFTKKVTHFVSTDVVKALIKAGLPPSSVPLLLAAAETRNITVMAAIPGISLPVFNALEKSESQAYADALRFIWYALLAFGVATAVLSLVLTPSANLMTSEVAAEVEHKHHSHHTHHKEKGVTV